ncbi:MAG TPA: adenylyltransferase/cytidyltransferase family protein [Gaiellaceae bacterium]|nr:adenylyltransferase/cytidyltransferase family protein [Gaiellaceae bacterium]
MTGLLGGSFDPPHVGHVALLRGARARFRLERVVVLVVADPGHKEVTTDAHVRLALARAAFPGETVELDPHARTVDMLRASSYDDPLFLIGADEFLDLPTWKEPEGVLALARLGVAMRPGYPRARLDEVAARLGRPDRVVFFEVEPFDVSSREIRARVAAGKPIDGLVPAAVAREIERLGLYRNGSAHG